eukprot:scaffold7670_cov160-Amphora_coffeaeformis.AAC.8
MIRVEAWRFDDSPNVNRRKIAVAICCFSSKYYSYVLEARRHHGVARLVGIAPVVSMSPLHDHKTSLGSYY